MAGSTLDGSLVRGIAADPARRIFVRSITPAAKAHGLTMTVEHVGDQPTLEFLRGADVDLAQAYYLGKPFEWRPAEDQ